MQEFSSAHTEFRSVHSNAIIVTDAMARAETAELIRSIQAAWLTSGKAAWARIAQVTGLSWGQVKRLACQEMTVPAHVAETIRLLAERELETSARQYEARVALLRERRAALNRRTDGHPG